MMQTITVKRSDVTGAYPEISPMVKYAKSYPCDLVAFIPSFNGKHTDYYHLNCKVTNGKATYHVTKRNGRLATTYKVIIQG